VAAGVAVTYCYQGLQSAFVIRLLNANLASLLILLP
jgi:hypothetical protein